MPISVGRFSSVFSLLTLVMLGVCWGAFAPIQLGGPAAYVIINGNSMEPHYYRGDLVILHTATDYQIGDIVTYRHPDIGPVIHRIIGRTGERWIFKGDHNDFIDPYRPVQADLIGRAWIHLPSVGIVLERLRSPLAMALLALGLGGFLMSSIISDARPHSSRKYGQRPTRARPAATTTSAGRDGLLTALGLLALAAVVLGAVAFTRPSARAVADDLHYQQSGVFSYAAAAPPGLYDTPAVQTGEPVFRKLSRNLIVDFSYRLESTETSEIHGTYRLVAQLSLLNGWKRTIELQPERSFSGGVFTVRGVLDLAEVQALIVALETQTELDRQQYLLAIVPEVRVAGTLAGQALQDAFAPRLEFRLDALQLQLLKDDHGDQDPLMPTIAGLLQRMRSEPNTIGLFGRPLAVPDARWIALAGLALALAGASVVGVPLLRAMRRDEATRIWLKYGALIVDSVGGVQPNNTQVIELATIGDLAKLAEKHGAPILHETTGTAHRYLVHATTVVYRYQSGGGAARQPAAGILAELPAKPASTPTLLQDVQEPGRDDSPPACADAPAELPAQWQAAFLAALCVHGRAPAACRAAGISITMAYEERERVPTFALAWVAAQARVQQRQQEGETAI